MRQSPTRTIFLAINASPTRRIVSVLSKLTVVICLSCIVLYSLDGLSLLKNENCRHQNRNLLLSNAMHSTWLRPNHSAQCQVHTLLENLHNYEDLESFYACQRVLYNRVPKCASRTVLSSVKILAKEKSFNFVSDPKKMTSYFLSDQQEQYFVQNFSSEEEPLFYTRHILHVNFTKYNMTPPVYINVVRDPLERVVSHFYYNMYGDNNKISLNTSSAMPHKTLDECVKDTESCGFRLARMLPFFCGHSQPCRRNNHNLLAIAKRNVKTEFLVVGLMEDLGSFMEVLETLLPHFFTNASTVFYGIDSAKKKQYKTNIKYPLLPGTEEKLREILEKEYDFYKFIKQRFYNLLERVRSVKRKLYNFKAPKQSYS